MRCRTLAGVVCLAASFCTHPELWPFALRIGLSGLLSHKVNLPHGLTGRFNCFNRRLQIFLRRGLCLIRSSKLCATSCSLTPRNPVPYRAFCELRGAGYTREAVFLATMFV